TVALSRAAAPRGFPFSVRLRGPRRLQRLVRQAANATNGFGGVEDTTQRCVYRSVGRERRGDLRLQHDNVAAFAEARNVLPPHPPFIELKSYSGKRSSFVRLRLLIESPFTARRAPCADQPNRLTSVSMRHNEHVSQCRSANRHEALLAFTGRVRECRRERIVKHGRRLLEANAMLSQVGNCLRAIPFELPRATLRCALEPT